MAEILKQDNSEVVSPSFFSDRNGCMHLRDLEEQGFSSKDATTEASNAADNTIIAVDIIRGVLAGDFDFNEIKELVSEGVGDAGDTTATRERRIDQLSELIKRYLVAEKRTPLIPNEKFHVTIEGREIEGMPHLAFIDKAAHEVEVVRFKAGKANLSQKETASNSIFKHMPTYIYLQMAKQLVPDDGQDWKIVSSVYALKKTTDNGHTKISASGFFEGAGNNVVWLEQYYRQGSTAQSELDKMFSVRFENFEAGVECTPDDCKNCYLNAMCNYVKVPEHREAKVVKKAGEIIYSEAQAQVVNHTEGLARVIAGAGAGKTECVAGNVETLISNMLPEIMDVNKALTVSGAAEIAAKKILLITFTNAGANEMKERVLKKLLRRDILLSADAVQAMTFNTFSYNIDKVFFQDLGYTKEPAVIDDVRQARIITSMIDEPKIDGLDYLNYRVSMPTCRGALACAVKTFELIKTMNLEDDLASSSTVDILRNELRSCGYYRFMSDQSIEQLVDVFEDYQERLIEDNLITFSDQEPFAFKMLDMHPEYLEELGYAHIIVDEFQDSNDIQMEMIKRLINTKCYKSLMVVGDDAQAIFAFRNATPENMIHFFEKIGREGKDICLLENRRSVPEILDLANQFIALNKERLDKDAIPVREAIGRKPVIRGFYNADEEYDFIIEQISDLIKNGADPEDIAFIAFTKNELVRMSGKLTEKGIPWVMMNPMTLVENSRVKAALSLCKAFFSPDSTILYFNYLTAKYDGAIFETRTVDEIKTEIADLKSIFSNIDRQEMAYQRILLHQYLDAIKGEDGTDEVYEYFLELLYQNPDLPSELQYVSDFEKYGENCAKKMELSYKGVVITTAHSSKGLEWKYVFNSISKYDNAQMHGRNETPKEERRRLLYVSMTRARDLLWVTGQYVAYGDKETGKVYNCFLKELYDITGGDFQPIDPMESVREAERKEKAKARAKERAAEKKIAKLAAELDDTMAKTPKAKSPNKTDNRKKAATRIMPV